jgi:hypothetical protein
VPYCPKHGCRLTETVTDDVFCGVCRTATFNSLLTDLAQLLDAWKQTAPREWTEWDQSLRDRISGFLQPASAQGERNDD